MANIPVSYYRGGTSKASFFHEKDIPPAGPERDALLKRLKGSPDPMQIDGLGGTHIVTSKIAIIRPSDWPDVDVDYTFGQVSVKDDHIGYNGNCGNISAAVGPFAITEGLVKQFRQGVSPAEGVKTQLVRFFVTGTGKVMEEHVPVDDQGRVVTKGDFSIDGCPGTGAPILIDFKGTIGGACGRGILPSGNAMDVAIVDGKEIDYSVCDVGNIIVFARAADLGIKGNESPAELDKNTSLLNRVRELRGRVAQLHGLCDDWQKVDEQAGNLPMTALVSPATAEGGHIQSRLFLDNKCHTAMAGSGSVCHAACSRMQGTIVNEMLRPGTEDAPILNIQHPCGFMPAAIALKKASDGQTPEFESLSFVRTARRIFKGELDVPDNVEHLVHADAAKKKPAVNGSAQVNGTSRLNGETTGVSPRDEADGATKALANFVAGFRSDSLPSSVVQKLKELLLDYIAVAAGATTCGESTSAFMATLKKSAASHKGSCTVFGHGTCFAPASAGLFNAALAHTLDFDDTYAPGALHPGVTIISAALAQAEALGDVRPDEFLVALAVGYEVVCRIAKALGTGGYAKGFHNTSTCGIFGAVAVSAALRKLDANIVENAFGLAISKAAGSMQYLENGAWNKRLHPGFAVADAFLCIQLAESGVVGAAKPIEGKFGALNLFALHSQPEHLDLASLGQRWEFLSTGIKPFAACRMTHGQIEMAGRFSRGAGSKKVKAIKIGLAPPCVPVVGAPHQNKVHPKTVVDAQFSSYYQTAVAYLYGDGIGWAAYDHMSDAAVADLCDTISVEADEALSSLQSWMSVEWEDGSSQREVCLYPKGETERPLEWADLRQKFDSLVVPAYGALRGEDIATAVKNIESVDVGRLMALLSSGS